MCLPQFSGVSINAGTGLKHRVSEKLYMGLDTVGFVISRSPVRSRRVAPLKSLSKKSVTDDSEAAFGCLFLDYAQNYARPRPWPWLRERASHWDGCAGWWCPEVERPFLISRIHRTRWLAGIRRREPQPSRKFSHLSRKHSSGRRAQSIGIVATSHKVGIRPLRRLVSVSACSSSSRCRPSELRGSPRTTDPGLSQTPVNPPDLRRHFTT